MHVETLLTVGCWKAGVTIKKSLIRHPYVRMGIFEARLAKVFGMGMYVGYYYGFLVHADISHPQHTAVRVWRVYYGSSKENIS